MANLTEEAKWEDGIYQFEETDVVQGGPQGIDNVPTGQLANRTSYLKKEQDALKKKFDGEETPNPLPQYLKLETLVGMRLHDSFAGINRTAIALRGDGTEVSRTDYPKLLQFAIDNDQLVDQALIDADPTTYAANYGTGDGATTFTLPNYGLMPWQAAAGIYGAAGTTVEDQIQNITAQFSIRSIIQSGNSLDSVLRFDGAFFKNGNDGDAGLNASAVSGQTGEGAYVAFDASRVARTGDHVRPKTHFSDEWIIHGEQAA